MNVEQTRFYNMLKEAITIPMSPADREQILCWDLLNSLEERQTRAFLRDYRKVVERFVDGAVADHPYIDREKQMDVFWNCPIMPAKYLVYKHITGLSPLQAKKIVKKGA